MGSSPPQGILRGKRRERSLSGLISAPHDRIPFPKGTRRPAEAPPIRGKRFVFLALDRKEIYRGTPRK
jgi:hypothetical protein